MSDTVLKVEHLYKRYRLGTVGATSFGEDLQRLWAKIRGKSDPFEQYITANELSAIKSADEMKALKARYVWALQDINFEVKQGEILGIIGKNGAGKSTLLKILSKTTAPTRGEVKVKGRVASLLEVGTGFHPELTGRENIFLNGHILGMNRHEIRAHLDEIIDFAGVEAYLDTPVKRYSSGMYVRLAFAVAAHLLADILIVDEVLAVGDAEFQKKCLGKMKDVSAGEGRTVLFVSHNMAAVKNLCSKSIFMEEGRLSCEGETSYVIKTYCNKYLSNKQTKYWIRDNQDTNNQVCFKEVRIALKGNQPHLILEIYFNLVFSKNAAPAFVAFDIKNSAGVTLMQAIPKLEPFVKYSEDSYEYICNIDLVGIIPDSYFVSCWIGAHYTVTYDYLEDIVSFEVLTGPMTGRTFPYAVEHGNLIPNSKIYKLHEKYN